MDGPDIKLAGYPAHSKSWLSGLSLVLKSYHILDTIYRAYLISKTGARSKKNQIHNLVFYNQKQNPQS